jgi:hypothetical protein
MMTQNHSIKTELVVAMISSIMAALLLANTHLGGIWHSRANPIQDVLFIPNDPGAEMLTGALMKSWSGQSLLLDPDGSLHSVENGRLVVPRPQTSRLFKPAYWRVFVMPLLSVLFYAIGVSALVIAVLKHSKRQKFIYSSAND